MKMSFVAVLFILIPFLFLRKAVFPDGKLGWVQPVGGWPVRVGEEMTEAYGVGAFLLAGSEIYYLLGYE